jgi:hypothetical protein
MPGSDHDFEALFKHPFFSGLDFSQKDFKGQMDVKSLVDDSSTEIALIEPLEGPV